MNSKQIMIVHILLMSIWGTSCSKTEKSTENPKVNTMEMEGYELIFPGTFTMGCNPRKEDCQSDEREHSVIITKPFWMKATEVTYGEWKSIMGEDPFRTHFWCRNIRCPVASVSWEEATLYCNSMSKKEGLELCYENGQFKGTQCTGYRLPTEAEWEYAARAGTTQSRYGDLDRIAVSGLGEKKTGTTLFVASRQPNTWGLYDMLGNVQEWCSDWYEEVIGSGVDPIGPKNGRYRVIRGGSWRDDPNYVRSANRFYAPPSSNGSDNTGFRMVKSIVNL